MCCLVVRGQGLTGEGKWVGNNEIGADTDSAGQEDVGLRDAGISAYLVEFLMVFLHFSQSTKDVKDQH